MSRQIFRYLKTLLPLWLALFPALAQAAYFELAPGGTVIAGSTMDDTRLLVTGLIRLSMGFLALFAVIKGIQGYFVANHTHGGSQEAMDGAWVTMQDSVKFVVAAIVIAAAAPYAVNLMFNMADNGGVNLF